VFEAMRRRFHSRLTLGLALARVQRFVEVLEPVSDPSGDPFKALAGEFRNWRRALRERDADLVLDALEKTYGLLEVCRSRVTAHDALIEAFRVRWACENASLSFATLDSLGLLYRTLPPSSATQSKYEYVLTRLLAGPIGPDRRLVPTEELAEVVGTLELQWSAAPVTLADADAAGIASRLKEFAAEAARQEDAAAFTASAVLRRFGMFKAQLGASLFDPRVSVAVVEANVAVMNVLNKLLTDAGGQPQRSAATRVRTDAIKRRVLKERTGSGETAKTDGGAPAKAKEDLKTGEVDLSGLEFLRGRRKASTADVVPASPQGAPVPPPDPEHRTDEIQAPRKKPDLRSGEVDLSGLDIVPLRKRAEASVTGSDTTPMEPVSPPEGVTVEPPGRSARVDGPFTDTAQQPSRRARELGKNPENATLIERYLAEPRSPEIWQLDVDAFLSPLPSGQSSDGHAADRRRALELIIDSDDLVCMRLDDESLPSADYKAHVNLVAGMMLTLRTALHRAIESAPVLPKDLETLLYVSDHLLWARLRLETSLKRSSKRPRQMALPRQRKVVAKAAPPVRGRRIDRRILMAGGVLAAAIVAAAILARVSFDPVPVDTDVRTVNVRALPNPEVFEDARSYRDTLFVSAGKTWLLLRSDQRRLIVRALGVFAAERGLVSVSVIGPSGEPWGSFKDDQALLDGELQDPERARAGGSPE